MNPMYPQGEEEYQAIENAGAAAQAEAEIQLIEAELLQKAIDANSNALFEIVKDFQTAFACRVAMKPEPEHLQWFIDVTKRMNDVLRKIENH